MDHVMSLAGFQKGFSYNEVLKCVEGGAVVFHEDGFWILLLFRPWLVVALILYSKKYYFPNITKFAVFSVF